MLAIVKAINAICETILWVVLSIVLPGNILLLLPNNI